MRLVTVAGLLLLGMGCATTRVVHLDTGQGEPVTYTSVDVDPVEVSEAEFKAALTQLILDMRLDVAHICTNKNAVSVVSGGPWTPICEEIFEKAGMSLEDVANKVRLKGHEGPHPEAYHREVVDRLRAATAACDGPAQCRLALIDELARIANDLLTPGTDLRRYIVKGEW